MLRNYDTQGIGMHHIYIFCLSHYWTLSYTKGQPERVHSHVCDWLIYARWERVYVSVQLLFHRWHNDDPVWSVRCNNRVPSTVMSACRVPRFHITRRGIASIYAGTQLRTTWLGIYFLLLKYIGISLKNMCCLVTSFRNRLYFSW